MDPLCQLFRISRYPVIDKCSQGSSTAAPSRTARGLLIGIRYNAHCQALHKNPA